MTDKEKWEGAVAAVSLQFTGLPPQVKECLHLLLKRVQTAKKAVHSHADSLRGAEICAMCGGECCVTGKHHFTVIELLAFLVSGREVFTPRFNSGRCPYLGDSGCLMPPHNRPFNCVTFNCERLDPLLGPEERHRFLAAEQELRGACREVEELFDNRFMHGLIINFERDLLQQRPILRGVAESQASYAGENEEN